MRQWLYTFFLKGGWFWGYQNKYEILTATESVDILKKKTTEASLWKTLASIPRDIRQSSGWNELFINILPRYFSLLGLLTTNYGLQ